MRSVASICRPSCAQVTAAGRARLRSFARPRHLVVKPLNALMLTPVGDGTLDHLQLPPGTAPKTIPLAGPFTLENGRHVVGRSSDSEVCVNLPTVSGRHAVIEIDGEDALISDLRSTNGTNVNGMDLEPLQPYQLPLGSVIVFGDAHLAAYMIHAKGDPAPLQYIESRNSSTIIFESDPALYEQTLNAQGSEHSAADTEGGTSTAEADTASKPGAGGEEQEAGAASTEELLRGTPDASPTATFDLGDSDTSSGRAGSSSEAREEGSRSRSTSAWVPMGTGIWGQTGDASGAPVAAAPAASSQAENDDKTTTSSPSASSSSSSTTTGGSSSNTASTSTPAASSSTTAADVNSSSGGSSSTSSGGGSSSYSSPSYTSSSRSYTSSHNSRPSHSSAADNDNDSGDSGDSGGSDD